MPNRRNLALAVVSFAVLGGAFSRLLGGGKLPRFPYDPSPLSPAQLLQLAAARPGWESAVLRTADGHSLNGLLRRPRAASAPWVLFFNGNGPHLLEDSQAFLETLRGERDWGLSTWAPRGFDGSTGTPSPQAWADDVALALRTLREREHPSVLHLVGFSMGAHLAVGAASAGVDTLTLLAPFTQIEVHPRSALGRFTPDVFSTLPKVAAVRAKAALVLHGAADSAVPPAQGREVAAALRARFVEVPGAGHLELLESPVALEAVRAFFQAPPAP
jgi:pimeloyl-ACP methyl ester carboxylesterase